MQVPSSEAHRAQVLAPSSLPANSAFFRVNGIGRSAILSASAPASLLRSPPEAGDTVTGIQPNGSTPAPATGPRSPSQAMRRQLLNFVR